MFKYNVLKFLSVFYFEYILFNRQCG